MKPTTHQLTIIALLESGHKVRIHAGYYLLQKNEEFKGVRVSRPTLAAMKRKGIINEFFLLTNK